MFSTVPEGGVKFLFSKYLQTSIPSYDFHSILQQKSRDSESEDTIFSFPKRWPQEIRAGELSPEDIEQAKELGTLLADTFYSVFTSKGAKERFLRLHTVLKALNDIDPKRYHSWDEVPEDLKKIWAIYRTSPKSRHCLGHIAEGFRVKAKEKGYLHERETPSAPLLMVMSAWQRLSPLEELVQQMS